MYDCKLLLSNVIIPEEMQNYLIFFIVISVKILNYK